MGTEDDVWEKCDVGKAARTYTRICINRHTCKVEEARNCFQDKEVCGYTETLHLLTKVPLKEKRNIRCP